VTCKTCAHYGPKGGIEGICRRYPPQHPGQYPKVWHNDTCGEHKPKPGGTNAAG
jgi:hypothetical protein